MKKKNYQIKTKVFLYPGMAAWHFVGLSKSIGQEIKENFGKNAKGFGSLRVEVSIRKTVWKTSIFPEKSSGSYLLPIKASVRKKENIEAGDEITFKLKIDI